MKAIITELTVLQIPEETWHGQVEFKKLGAPITYLQMYMSDRYGKVVKEGGLEIHKDGGIPE